MSDHPRAVAHAVAELHKLALDPQRRPARYPQPGRMRGIDHYNAFGLISAIATGAAMFERVHGFWPSLDRPTGFCERIFGYKYLGELPCPPLGDKLAARQWVEARVGPEVLTRLLWAGTDLAEARDLGLPAGLYMLKASHGSGLNQRLVLPQAFERAPFEALSGRTRGWLASEWGRAHGEWFYGCFVRRLFIEAFIDFSSTGTTPDDYKFWCFDGIVRMVHVNRGRYGNHHLGLYTPGWRLLPVRLGHPPLEIARPAGLDRLIAIAEAISAGLRFVRVDLYFDGRDQVRFGEMTFVPGNAIAPFSDPGFDLALGRYLAGVPTGIDPLEAWLAGRR